MGSAPARRGCRRRSTWILVCSSHTIAQSRHLFRLPPTLHTGRIERSGRLAFCTWRVRQGNSRQASWLYEVSALLHRSPDLFLRR